jgi:thioester reductase-like protein
VDDKKVKEVHCIAIRPDKDGKQRHVDNRSAKVIEYSGDLSDRNLGLSESQIQFLSETAHLIIHNGADVSFLKTYQSLRRSNFLSTRTLVDIAILRSIPLHFVSTASVANFTGKDSLPEVSVRDFTPPQDSDGYPTSKWASEVFLEKVSLDRGLPTWIHRPTSIVGEDAPTMDMMKTLLQFSRLLQAVPKMKDSFHGAFDFVKVADVSTGLVNAALESVFEVEQPPKVHFVHHCNKEKVLPEDFKRYMEQTDGCKFEEWNLEAWVGKARDAGLNMVVYESLQGLLSQNRRIVFPVIHKNAD